MKRMGNGWRMAVCLGWVLAGAGVQAQPVQQVAPTGTDGAALSAGPVEGVALADWTAEWWRWGLSLPVQPWLDRDGSLCALDQRGPVWFLAGTDGSFQPRRRCTVPEGRYLLVPVINMVHYSGRVPRPCRELRAGAAVNNDHLVSAVVLLDGKPLGDMRAHRVRSDGCFRLDPDDDTSPLAAADGYWILLRPLSRGRHTLSVGANYAPGNAGRAGMQQTFEYILQIGERPVLSMARPPASHAGSGHGDG